MEAAEPRMEGERMNLPEIVNDWLEELADDAFETSGDELLHVLRAAVDAPDGATITIGPDGTVGRLVWPKTEDGYDAAAISPEVHGRKVGWYGLRTDGRLESPDHTPLYRVVTS